MSSSYCSFKYPPYVNENIVVCEQKNSKSFMSQVEESMAGHVGLLKVREGGLQKGHDGPSRS
jgi:hypothetical protein